MTKLPSPTNKEAARRLGKDLKTGVLTPDTRGHTPGGRRARKAAGMRGRVKKRTKRREDAPGTKILAYDQKAFLECPKSCRPRMRACGKCQECIADRNAKYLRDRGIPESRLTAAERTALARARARNT